MMGTLLHYFLAGLPLLSLVSGQGYVLTPPYFNIAENRPITASATCGEGVGVGKCVRLWGCGGIVGPCLHL